MKNVYLCRIMRKPTLFILFAFSLSLLLSTWSCNSDIFVDRLTVSADTLCLGPDALVASAKVSNDVDIESVILYSNEGVMPVTGGDGVFSYESMFASLRVIKVKNRIDIELHRFVADTGGTLEINLDNGYEETTLVVKIFPTDHFDVKIESVTSVSYTHLTLPTT